MGSGEVGDDELHGAGVARRPGLEDGHGTGVFAGTGAFSAAAAVARAMSNAAPAAAAAIVACFIWWHFP